MSLCHCARVPLTILEEQLSHRRRFRRGRRRQVFSKGPMSVGVVRTGAEFYDGISEGAVEGVAGIVSLGSGAIRIGISLIGMVFF